MEYLQRWASKLLAPKPSERKINQRSSQAPHSCPRAMFWRKLIKHYTLYCYSPWLLLSTQYYTLSQSSQQASIGWNLSVCNPTSAETPLIDILVVFKLSVGTNSGAVFNVGGSGCLNQWGTGEPQSEDLQIILLDEPHWKSPAILRARRVGQTRSGGVKPITR